MVDGSEQQGRLQNRVAIVTGAASGIGLACATRFVAEGMRVVLADIQDEAGEALAAELGGDTRYVHTNVTDEEDVAALVGEAVSSFGRLDVMFNNAGAMPALGSILELTREDFDWAIALLLRSVFFGTKHAGRVMVEQGDGLVLNTASIAGLHAGEGPHLYGLAKSGVVYLTQSTALELGEQGVRVNAICPGGMPTPFVLGLVGLGPEDAENLGQGMAMLQPIKRPGRPEDIANAAAWLAGDEAGFVTGQTLTVDGGASVGKLWSQQLVK